MTNRMPTLLDWQQVRNSEHGSEAWRSPQPDGRVYYASHWPDAQHRGRVYNSLLHPGEPAHLNWVLYASQGDPERVVVRQTHRDFAGCQNAAAQLEAEGTWWTP